MSDQTETGTETIKVAIIEDQRPIRDCLAVLLNGTSGFRCTASFNSMEEALEKIGVDPPDIALVDLGLPGMSGIAGMRILKELRPELRLLALTVYDDDDRIFDALCAGASGYLLKKTPPARLRQLRLAQRVRLQTGAVARSGKRGWSAARDGSAGRVAARGRIEEAQSDPELPP